MAKIVITKAAHDAIRARALHGFRDTSDVQPDGSRALDVEQEVVDRLLALAHPGETASDTLIRIAALQRH